MIPSVLLLHRGGTLPRGWESAEDIGKDAIQYESERHRLIIESNTDYVAALYKGSEQLYEQTFDDALDAAIAAAGMMSQANRVEQHVYEYKQ